MRRMSESAIMLLSALVAGMLGAADIPVVWTTGATPVEIGDGALAFTYAGEEIATIVATPGAGNRVVVTGDAMAFASGATVTAVNGEVVFRNAATGHGNLAVAPQTDDAELTWGDGSVALDTAPNWTLLFPGKSLDEFEPTTAKGPTGSSNPPNTSALTFHRFTRMGSGASAVLVFQASSQHKDASLGNYMKVVTGRFRQASEGIEGVVEAAYLVSYLPYHHAGDDIDYIMAHPTDYPDAKTTPLATPGQIGSGRYGIGILTMVRIVGKPSVRFENTLTDVDGGTLALNVASGVSVTAAGTDGVAPTPFDGAVTSAKGGEFGFTDRSVTTTQAFGLGGTFNVKHEAVAPESAYRECLGGYLTPKTWYAIPGVRLLEDLTNAVGVAAGSNVGSKNRGKPMGLYNYKIAANGMSATGQFQVGDNGQDEFVRFVRAEFSAMQTPGQVSIRLASAGYYATNATRRVGADVDLMPSSDVKSGTVAASDSASGYTVHDITNFFSKAPMDLVKLSGYLMPKAWYAIPGARSLEDFASAIGIAAGGNVGGKNRGKPIGLYNYKIAADKASATGQFQIGDNGQDEFVRFVRAEFSATQATHQVSMRLASAGYYPTNATRRVGADVDLIPSSEIKSASVGASDEDSGYAIHDVAIVFSRAAMNLVELTSSANSFSNGAKVVVGGSDDGRVRLVLSDEATSLPKNGRLVIKAGGSAVYGQIGANTDIDYADGTCPIDVLAGGELIDRVETISIGPKQEINLLGGTLRCGYRLGYDKNAIGDAGTYVNLLTLADGAVVESPKAIRIGYQRDDPRWMVRGSSPSVCNAELYLMSRSQSGTATMPFTFDVWDVTGDNDPDFTINGRIGNKYKTEYSYGYIVKTGSGTLRLAGGTVGNPTRLPVELRGGTLEIGSAGAGGYFPGFVFGGGNLSVAAGITTSVGTLAASVAGTVHVGSGASVAFADSSAVEWTLPVGARVIIDADLGENSTAVRFGTNANGLTGAQIRSIRTPDGGRVMIDANGYLHLGSPGLILTVR